MISQQEENIIGMLNLFRTCPPDATAEIDKNVECLKTSDRANLLFFSQRLQTKSPVPKLTKSISLTKLAEAKLKFIIENRDKAETEKEATARINLNVVGYTELIEIYHKGTPENFNTEIFSSDLDPKRENREKLFNQAFRYVGIAVEKIEGDKNKLHHFIICLCDRLVEEDSRPLDMLIVEAINEVRKAPIRKSDELLLISEGSKDKDFKTNIGGLVTRLSSSALPLLERNKFLDDVALNVYEKIQSKEYNDPSDEGTLAEIAYNTIHNFQRIHFANFQNVKSTKEIINLILANPKSKEAVLINTRKIVIGKSMKYIGIHYVGHGEKINSMTLVTVDEFYPGSKKEYFSYFSDELNRLKLTPKTYENDLDVFKKNIRIKTYKQALIEEIKDFKIKLTELEPMNPIKNHPLLNSICEDYVYHEFQGKLYKEDDEQLLERLNLAISGHTKAKLFVNMAVSRPENFITQILIDEGSKEKENRKEILSNEYKYFGCYHTLKGDSSISILVLVDNVEERKFLLPHEEILERINLTRVNPRSLVKFICEYEKELKESLKSATQNTVSKKKFGGDSKIQALQEKIQFCENVCDFLKVVKLRPKAKRCLDLKKALDDKICSKDPKAIMEQEELREYLKEYVNNTFFCSMFCGVIEVGMFEEPKEGKDSEVTEKKEGEEKDTGRKFLSGPFLAKLIIEEGNFNTLQSIFAFPLRYLETVLDLENDIVLGFFVDHAVEKTKIEVPLDIRQRVKRPTFTNDELEQLRNDFNRLDILNEGFVKPDTIVVFMNNSMRFINNNPIYYAAFKELNTVENNQMGVNVNQFIDAVAEVIGKYSEENWKNIYSLITKENNKRTFDKKMFFECLTKLGYKIHESESNDMFDRFSIEKPDVNSEEFVKMMIMAEKGILVDQAKKPADNVAN